MQKRMDTRQLEEFLVLAQELNYSAAAKRLFITRPTLVEHIRSLEAELECKLVESDGKHIALASGGKRFVITAESLLKTWRETKDEYSSLSENLLTVKIATTNLPWLETLIYKARRSIHKTHPYKHIEIVTDNGPLSTIEALEERRNDITIAGYKEYLEEAERPELPQGIRGFPISIEEIKLLMTREHPFFEMGSIKTQDLDGQTFILPPDIYRSWSRDGMVDQFERRGTRVCLQTLDFSDHSEYFTYEFAANLGIIPTTLVPRFGIDQREEYRAFSLEDWSIRTRFYALFKEEFTETENGSLLYREMERLASQAPCS